jgi:hypothetical protein
MNFARTTGRTCLALHDEPLKSWYPGTTQGIVFSQSAWSQQLRTGQIQEQSV